MNPRTSLALTGLLALLRLPELALAGFFLAGVVLAAHAEAAQPVNRVVVLGGDGAGGVGGRYAHGRDLVLAEYSKRLMLIHPRSQRSCGLQGFFSGDSFDVLC